MQNRVFFPQAALDQWIVDEAVELSGNELTLVGEARRFRIAEAVYIKGEVTGTPDTNELVGKVKSRTFLTELGAEIVESSMILGDNAYDVVPGWMGSGSGALEGVKTDEELLARFLAKRR